MNARATAAGFLAGMVVGAVIAAAAILLAQSSSPVARAAAAVPLTAAVAVAVAVVALSARGGAAENVGAMQGLGLPGEPKRRDPGVAGVDPANPETPTDRVAARSQAAPAFDDPPAPSQTGAAASDAVPLDPPDGEAAPDEEAAPQSSPDHPAADRVDTGKATVAEPASDVEKASAPGTPSADGSVDAPPGIDKPARPGAENDAAPDPDIPAALINAWDRYRIDGDGFFTAAGLQAQVDALGIGASVREGGEVGASGDVLVVEVAPSGSGRFFVVPSFTNSPSAAPHWFEDASGGARFARTRTIHRLAEGKWTKTSFTVIEKGVIG